LGTRGKHATVLHHLMGFPKNHLSSEDKQELLGLIEDYRQGLVPLTLLKHHLNRYPVPDWAHQQVYLNPYPKELMLRNHVSARRARTAVQHLGHGLTLPTEVSTQPTLDRLESKGLGQSEWGYRF
jgi:hypothetical protein